MRSGYNDCPMVDGTLPNAQTSPIVSAGTEAALVFPAGAESVIVLAPSKDIEYRRIAGGGTLGVFPIPAGIPFEIPGKPGQQLFFGRAAGATVIYFAFPSIL